MKTLLIRKEDRGSANHGWLKANHYFSFGSYRNDKMVHFGALRVLNDDFIAGGTGFPTHPHDNMEIITIPFTGKLAHKDSTGGEGIIAAGDVQIMSAGSGVEHSEKNASSTEPITLFQTWLFPKIKNITPRYDQRTFDKEDRKDKWQIVVSPKESDNALFINQDAKFSLADLSAGKTLSLTKNFDNSGFFIVAISGKIEVGGEVLNTRDAIGLSDIESIEIKASEDAEILAIELPMVF